MVLRVVGAGLGRTGTHSLKLAFERLLGAPCYHMTEVFKHPAHLERWTAAGHDEPVNWRVLLQGFVATVDWPAAAYWKELSEAFPEAIIVLSTRPSADWWKSASETIFAGRSVTSPAMKAMFASMMGHSFTPDYKQRDSAIAAYERHNASVRATAPPEKLVDWTLGDGWEPLCRALDLPVPAEPFPHSNTTAEFIARPTGPQHR